MDVWPYDGQGARQVSRFIAALDRSVDRYGQDVILRRTVGTANRASIDCRCRASVRNYDPTQLAGTIQQGDSQVVLSPTDIDRVQWPGPEPIQSPPRATDPRIPRVTDVVVIGGRSRSVVAAVPFVVNGELVRVELQVRG